MFFFHSTLRLTYEAIEQSAKYLAERTCHRPRIGIICGSGLGKKNCNNTSSIGLFPDSN